jgi:hypothetical protein
MRVLAISDFLPMPDRASGDLRFFTLLSLLAKHHALTLCALNTADQKKRLGDDAFALYREGLVAQGVSVAVGLSLLLRNQSWDVVLFEFYQPAMAMLDEVRFRQPGARIVIDSVDVHFRRFAAKAELTGAIADREMAEQVQGEELDIYRRADMVVVVTEDDRQTLRGMLPDLPMMVLPNVHDVFPPADPSMAVPNSMIFVGGFLHEPNVDAMLYFCAEVMPLIKKQIPSACLSIVGSNPPAAIQALASDSIEVTGYVPDTAPYLEKSRVSIAPLRYGAGMKGKIGEAMSHGLPVVTTSVGAEGFGLTPGENILVGDSATEFAEHVVRLMQDHALHERIRLVGWEFIRSRYSVEAVEGLCQAAMSEVTSLPVRSLPLLKRLHRVSREAYEKNIGWRFR